MKFTGGCYCKALRYEATEEPKIQSQCHCRECQYISGGGPNYFMLVPVDHFTYTNGAPATFARTDIDSAVTREFCITCGTHIATKRPGLGMVILKAGSLDDPSIYGKPGAAIYICDAQPYHHIPGDIPSFDKLPKR
ncbi:MAG: GFA family protein [Salaquimonas sp.]